MKIALAQIESDLNDPEANILLHKKCISKAASKNAHLIVFPELSLTGYALDISRKHALSKDDPIFLDFQKLSNLHSIVICLGFPLKHLNGIQICMAILRPQEPPLFYSKQYLHEDELPYFVAGEEMIQFKVKNLRITPAICYESMQKIHLNNALAKDFDLYLVSVAKHKKGMAKAYEYYNSIAQNYKKHVAVVNNIGPADNYMSCGKSCVWKNDGTLLGQAPEFEHNILYSTL